MSIILERYSQLLHSTSALTHSRQPCAIDDNIGASHVLVLTMSLRVKCHRTYHNKGNDALSIIDCVADTLKRDTILLAPVLVVTLTVSKIGH